MLVPTVLLQGFRALLGSQADLYHPLRIGLEYWQRNEQKKKIMSLLGLGKQTQKGDNHNFKKCLRLLNKAFIRPVA